MFRRGAIHLDCAAGWIIKTCSLPPDDFSPISLVMVNAVYGTGALFKALKVRTVMVIVSPTFACALLLVETSRSVVAAIWRPSHCPNKKVVLLKAGMGVDVARGRSPTRATSLPPH